MTEDASGAVATPRHSAARGGRPPAAPATDDQRTAAMLTHGLTAIVAVVSVGSLGFLTSLIVFLIHKDKSDFVRAHAASAVNVQIMTAFGLFLAIMLSAVDTGAAITAAAIILAVAVAIHLMGALHANRGEWWTPPLTPRLVS